MYNFVCKGDTAISPEMPEATAWYFSWVAPVFINVYLTIGDMIKIFLFFLAAWAGGLHHVYGQTTENPFITVKSPAKENNDVQATRQYITGLTCKSCTININEMPVKVYATGAFAYEVVLPGPDSVFTITATANGRSVSKRVSYRYLLPKPAEPVSVLAIEKIQTFPEGDLVLRGGDVIQFKVKALPGSTVSAYGNTPLYELPASATNGMDGIYQGEYEVKPGDNFSAIKMPVTLVSPDGQKIMKETVNKFSILSPLASDVALTKGRLAHLEYGLGDDRLGGAKIGYLDSLIPLKIIGKVGVDYKIQLAKNRTAYIEEDLVTLLPKGSFAPSSLTTNWRVFGDSAYDYVQVGLFGRLPYQSMQLINPARIVVDVFGATNNTNWITQMENTKEITGVDYEQVADDILRITIQLKNKQHWGHQILYRGNTLVIKIKQQPKSLALKDLVIAVDAGHGGSNTGAQGITGVIEKDLALAVSLKLQKLLEKEGAKVIMSRTTERFFDNKERILFYRDSLPDLLVSVHLNSAVDPINTGGTMLFYRYAGFRPLSDAIYKRMLELGLKPGGITGSFNFMLNSPIEYPNALVETLFLSNLGEEARIIDPVFQQQVAEKIVAGIKDFLQEAKKN
jgi:N-acetylmuramoyl-L-alanine amidase